MKNRITATIVLSIVAVVVGIALNFNDFLMGNPAIMKYCSVFWILTLFISVVTGYANVTDSIVDWVILFENHRCSGCENSLHLFLYLQN